MLTDSYHLAHDFRAVSSTIFLHRQYVSDTACGTEGTQRRFHEGTGLKQRRSEPRRLLPSHESMLRVNEKDKLWANADRKQEEAIAVYSRLNSDRTSLIDEKRNDKATAPPFFWHHIRQDRRRQAVIDTWQQAKPGTIQRTLFDKGATTGEHAPNWVTLWLLYSVFRSRDIRNNRNRRAGEGSSGSEAIDLEIR